MDFYDTNDAMYKMFEYSTSSTGHSLYDYQPYITTNLLYNVYTTNSRLELGMYFYAELFTYTNPSKTWTFAQPPYCASTQNLYFPVPLTPFYANVSSGV